MALSLLACVNIVISVVYYSRSKPEYLAALSSITDAAYGLLLAGFVQLTGWLIFPLLLIGGAAVVPVFVGISGFCLMRGKDWARKFLILFSTANLIFWIAEISTMSRETSYRIAVGAAALLFHGFIAVYLSLLRKPTPGE